MMQELLVHLQRMFGIIENLIFRTVFNDMGEKLLFLFTTTEVYMSWEDQRTTMIGNACKKRYAERPLSVKVDPFCF